MTFGKDERIESLISYTGNYRQRMLIGTYGHMVGTDGETRRWMTNKPSVEEKNKWKETKKENHERNC